MNDSVETCNLCWGTGHYYKIGTGGPIPCHACAPAATVGGEWMMRLAKEIKANAEDHPGDYIAKFALAWADELAARAVSTPAAPVGGFVVVPRVTTTAQRLAMAKADDGTGDRYRLMAAALIAAAPRHSVTHSSAKTVLHTPDCDYHAAASGWPACTCNESTPTAQPSAHTTEDDYQHFLSYSGLEHSPLLRYAYYHGADVGMEKPKDAAQPSAKDGVMGIPMGGQNFVHNEKKILDAINTHEFAKEAVAGSFSGLTPREATTTAGLVDGPAITGYTVEDHEDWFTDPGDAAEMLREYADAKAGSEFYLTPWHQLPRQTLRITGPDYEDYEVEAAIGREVTK